MTEAKNPGCIVGPARAWIDRLGKGARGKDGRVTSDSNSNVSTFTACRSLFDHHHHCNRPALDMNTNSVSVSTVLDLFARRAFPRRVSAVWGLSQSKHLQTRIVQSDESPSPSRFGRAQLYGGVSISSPQRKVPNEDS
jgi:hypothetical protein